MTGQARITCAGCDAGISRNRDVESGYCGACRQWSPAEKAAQTWHNKRHKGRGLAEHWSRCNVCKRDNPHHTAAVRATLDDITTRISESLIPLSPPRQPDRR